MAALAESPAMNRKTTFAPAPDPTPGFPTPAMLADAGDPPNGTALTEEECLALETSFAAEWVGGRLSYLPMASEVHQRIVGFFYDWLRHSARAAGHTPMVLFAPFYVRVPNRLREPDLVMLLDKDDPRRGPQRWDGADLAVGKSSRRTTRTATWWKSAASTPRPASRNTGSSTPAPGTGASPC